jgi:hypothetical protein
MSHGAAGVQTLYDKDGNPLSTREEGTERSSAVSDRELREFLEELLTESKRQTRLLLVLANYFTESSYSIEDVDQL